MRYYKATKNGKERLISCPECFVEIRLLGIFVAHKDMIRFFESYGYTEVSRVV